MENAENISQGPQSVCHPYNKELPPLQNANKDSRISHSHSQQIASTLSVTAKHESYANILGKLRLHRNPIWRAIVIVNYIFISIPPSPHTPWLGTLTNGRMPLLFQVGVVSNPFLIWLIICYHNIDSSNQWLTYD